MSPESGTSTWHSGDVTVQRGRVALILATSMLATVTGASSIGTPVAASAIPVTASPVTARYAPFGPTRLADTREAVCGCQQIDANTIRIDVAGRDGMPADVVAAALTITATDAPTPGFVTAYPSGGVLPRASTLNTMPGRAVANSTVVALSADGAVEVYQRSIGSLVVDVTGVFVAAATANSGRYVSVPSRRLYDTRDVTPDGLVAGGDLTISVPAEADPDATALVLNITSIGERAPGFLTAHPVGQPAATSSFLNPTGTGQPIAATVILPVSAAGVTIGSLNGGHVLVDLLGWFTGPSAPASDRGLFAPIGPQRLIDTRQQRPRIWSGGTLEVPTPFPDAGSLVTNVTATSADRAGFVTAFPAGTPRPGTSALNPAFYDHTVANMSITQVSDRGLAYFGLHGTDLVVDVTGMFTGTPLTAVEPVPSTGVPPRSRVLMIGDSTLASVPLYTSTKAAFVGFDAVVDAASCRRLLRPSCLSKTTGVTPNTGVEAIQGAPGTFDIVVIKSGYNDWFSDFPVEFDAIVRAARVKGAHTILWLTLNEDVERPDPARAYRENNEDLRWLVQLPQYSDVLLADWLAYSRAAPDGWAHDGTHLTLAGTWLLTDFISRWIAAIEHRPCPRPWGPGGPNFDPCPKPELIGPVPSPNLLY